VKHSAIGFAPSEVIVVAGVASAVVSVEAGLAISMFIGSGLSAWETVRGIGLLSGCHLETVVYPESEGAGVSSVLAFLSAVLPVSADEVVEAEHACLPSDMSIFLYI
jgi:hypothetical protein